MQSGDNKALPFTVRPVPRPSEIRPMQSGKAASLRVLLVDDSPEDRVVVRLALESQGYHLSEVDNGERGVAAAAALRPDCILLDYNLPDLDGLEVLQAIRRPDGTIPCAVVMLTGSSDGQTVTSLLKAGALDCLSKQNLGEDSLRRAVHGAVERYRLLEQRRQAEERNAQFAAIVGSSADAIFSVGIDHVVRTWNAGAEALFGYTECEAVGSAIDDLIIPFDKRAERLQIFHAVSERRLAVRVESERQHKIGRRVAVEINASPMFDADGRVIALSLIMRDNSERLRAREALRQRNERLSQIAQVSSRLVLETSDEELGARSVLTGLAKSLGYELVFHFDADESARLLRLAASTGLTPEQREAFARIHFGQYLCGLVAQDRKPLVVENLQTCVLAEAWSLRDAGVSFYAGFPLLAQGVLLGTAAFATRTRDRLDDGELEHIQTICDLAAAQLARARVNSALRASEARYRSVISSHSELLCRFRLDGTLTLVNDAYAEAFARTRDELEGTSFFELIPQSEHDLIRNELARLTPEQPTQTVIHRALSADGSTRVMEWTNQRLRQDASTEDQFQAIGRDVTDRVRAEEALRESEARLAAVLQSLPVGIAVIDGEGRSLLANEVYRKFFPETVPSRDLARTSLWEATDEAGSRVQPHDFPAARALRGERVWPGMEFLFHGFASGPVWTRVAALPILDDRGVTIGAAAVVIDIDREKRGAEALREREEWLAAVFDQSAAGIAATDLSGRFTRVNDYYCSLSGRSRDELTELRMQDITHPDDLPADIRQFQALVEGNGGPFTIEKRYVRPDGTHVWVHNEVSMLRDAKGRVIHPVAISSDISERKLAEERLRESEQRLELALQASATGVWDFELATGRVTWSGHIQPIFGVDHFEGTRDAFAKFVHPEDAERLWKAVEAALSSGSLAIEFRIVRPDGQVRWVDNDAMVIRDANEVPVRMLGTVTDITERKQAELASARLAAVVTSAPSAVVALDRSSCITAWNPSAERLFDYAAGEALGRHISIISPEERRSEQHGIIERVLSGELVRIETQRRHKSGRLVDVQIDGSPIRDSNGEIIGQSYVLQDITERKQAENRLRASERRNAFLLTLSDRLRQLSDTAEISAEAARVLGEELGVARTAFYEIADGDYVVPTNYTRGVLPLTGRYPVDAYGRELLESQNRGQPFAVSDVSRVHSAAEVERFSQLQIGAYCNVPLVKNGQFVGGLTAHSPTPREWSPTEIGMMQDVAERTWAAVERGRAEAALRSAHDTFHHLVDGSPFGIYAVSADFRLVQVSAGAQKVFANVRPLIGRDFAEVIRILWPEPFATQVIERFRHTLATGEPYHSPSTVEQRADTAATEAYDWKIERVTLPDGRPGVVCHFYDLSERQRHEEHVQLLMREVNHRAKNMLGLIQAVARQTAATRPEDFIERFGQRIQALAANQDLLVKSEWKSVPLGDLIRSQLAHFGDLSDARVSLDGPPVEITAAASQALGLALHELATNAAMYGALSTDAGRVAVSWSVHSDTAGETRFAVSWRESGGPPVEKPARRGFGSTVMGSMIKMSLGCEAKIDFSKDGLVWRIDCPAESVLDGNVRVAIRAREAAIPQQPGLAGRRRVLVVEDEALIAIEIASALSDRFEVIGPASSVDQALSLIAQVGCDIAVLDTNLGAETAEPVARELIRVDKPFITVSGYSRDQQPAIMRTAPLISKPLRPELMLAAIEQSLRKK